MESLSFQNSELPQWSLDILHTKTQDMPTSPVELTTKLTRTTNQVPRQNIHHRGDQSLHLLANKAVVVFWQHCGRPTLYTHINGKTRLPRQTRRTPSLLLPNYLLLVPECAPRSGKPMRGETRPEVSSSRQPYVLFVWNDFCAGLEASSVTMSRSRKAMECDCFYYCQYSDFIIQVYFAYGPQTMLFPNATPTMPYKMVFTVKVSYFSFSSSTIYSFSLRSMGAAKTFSEIRLLKTCFTETS